MLATLTPGVETVPLRERSAPADAGEVASHKPLTHSFELENTGDREITILEVRRTCSCAKAEIAEKSVGPGRKATVRASFNLMAQPAGPGRWTVTVVYQIAGEPSRRELPLSVSAKVRRDVWVEPVSLVMSGEANLAGKVSVFDRRGKPLNVTGARVGLEQLSAKIEPAGNGEQRQTILLAVAESMPAGTAIDELSIDTDDPEFRELRIPVRIVKRKADESIKASPAMITLRGAGASKLVTLRDREERDIDLESLVSDEASLGLKWAKGPGGDATVRISLVGKAGPPSGTATVTAKLKTPVARTINILVEWSK